MIRQDTIYASLGELIATLYDQYLSCYNDPTLASIAVTATLNELLEDDWASARRIFGDVL